MHSGLRHFAIPDSVFGQTFRAIVLYPTAQAPVGHAIEGAPWPVTLGAPIAEGRFPVCVISHGAGGSHLLYATIATHLARAGWIVACPEAPRDNRNDNSLSYSDEAVTNRCVHLRATLDAVLGDKELAAAADNSRVAIVGHSLGGCAALALAGGQPWSRKRTPIPVQPDGRFRAAVLMAPASAYYRGPGALDRITIPLLVLAGEKDEITPAEDIRGTLQLAKAAREREFITVRGAGHFSFLSPFPAALRRPDLPPSQDPERFDREKFHRELPGLIESFLIKALGGR